MSFDRRMVLAAGSAAALSACAPLDTSPLGRQMSKLRIIEAASGGEMGAAIMNARTGVMFGNRLDERFAQCSSFKLSLAALAMQRSISGGDALDMALRVTADDITNHSPVTQTKVGQTMTIGELAESTMTVSDNAAANILLRRFGGPEAMTAFWRSLGDNVSRLDRFETVLNFVPPGEIRDTTTPRAMAQTVRTLLYGGTLPAELQQTLREWMVAASTGLRRIRAGMPATWIVGDRTGTAFAPGMGSMYVDLAFAERPQGDPMILAGYLRLKAVHQRVEPASEAVLASLGALATQMASQSMPA